MWLLCVHRRFKKRVRKAAECCAGGFPLRKAQLPVLSGKVNGRQVSALLDTGCSCSILDPSALGTTQLGGPSHLVSMMNGKTVLCQKIYNVSVEDYGGLSRYNLAVRLFYVVGNGRY